MTPDDPDVRSTPTSAPRAPYRKGEVVRAAILDATVELLSERPTHAVGIRDIAERAGVQHSLVTRHYGTREALIALAVDSVARDYAAAVHEGDDGAVGFVDAMRHLQDRPFVAFVLATPASERAGDDVADRFPGFAAHLRRLADDHDDADPDLRTKVVAGMAFGMAAAWNLYGPVLLAAADVDPEDGPEARALAEQVLTEFVQGALDR